MRHITYNRFIFCTYKNNIIHQQSTFQYKHVRITKILLAYFPLLNINVQGTPHGYWEFRV